MTNKEATLGLIMPNYNHAEFLEKAFSEIRSQAPYPQQFVVIDDGSTDQSRELIKKWEAESAANQAVYLPKNTGVNEATKSGLEQVTTDFFCPRSVDDTYFPNFIGQARSMFEAYPQTGLVCCRPLRFQVETSERTFGEPICEEPHFFGPEEAEQALRRNNIWDAGAVWRTEAFRLESRFDSRTRWIAMLHLGDVLALRHGFCYVPEPWMEYNIRPGAYSSGWNDYCRSTEALVATGRDLVSQSKRDIFPRCVRSGYLGLRGSGELAIIGVLNAAWKEHTKPLLLILQGLLELIGKVYIRENLPAEDALWLTNQTLSEWAFSFSEVSDEDETILILMDPILTLVAKTAWNNLVVGFFACYIAQKGVPEEAREFLQTRLSSSPQTKSVRRAFALIASQSESKEAADRHWREAINAFPKDVWFGMEYLEVLLSHSQLKEAKDLANDLFPRNPGNDVACEIAELFRRFGQEPPCFA